MTLSGEIHGGALKRTSLYGEHIGLGAHMVDFAGWEMPLYYSSILGEHMAVRNSAGLFDVSHMGELLLTGKNSESSLDRLSTNRIAGCPVGACIYTHFLDDSGRIIDDTIAMRTGKEEFLVVPNAATTETVMKWVSRNSDCSVSNISDDVSCIAVQGPLSAGIVSGIAPRAAVLGSFTGTYSSDGVEDFEKAMSRSSFFVSRTGYTGEDGFELFAPSADAASLWRKMLSSAGGNAVRPAGLGARDSLRLEMGYLLSGTDFDGKQTTLETGYGWVVKWDHDFIGKEALLEQRAAGIRMKLICLRVQGKSIPRHGDIFTFEGGSGRITSGGYSPVLSAAIAMGYSTPPAPQGCDVTVSVRDRKTPAVVVKAPFIGKR